MQDGFYFDRRGLGRTRETNRRVLGSLPRVPKLSRRHDDGLTSEDIVTGAGGGGCCCDEMVCLRIRGVTEPIHPSFYAFQMPTFRCGCSPAGIEAGKEVEGVAPQVKLYPTEDADIWESRRFLCSSAGIVDFCSNTTTWVWQEEECGGSCFYKLVIVPTGEPPTPVRTWVHQTEMGDCAAGCDCAQNELPDPDDPEYEVDDIVEMRCVPEGGVPGWELVSTTGDEGCECVPEEPDYDGTFDGQIAYTSCGISDEGAEGELLYTWWRLTIVETLDENGCDITKLEFLQEVGESEVAVLTYYLTRQGCNARPFCRQCTNSFTITTCGPTNCDVEPGSTICLTPKIPEGTQNTTGCCTNVAWTLAVSGLASTEPTSCGTCSDDLNGKVFPLIYVPEENQGDFSCWYLGPVSQGFWGYMFSGMGPCPPAMGGTAPDPCNENNKQWYAWTLECESGVALTLKLYTMDYSLVDGGGFLIGPSLIGTWTTQGAYDCDAAEGVELEAVGGCADTFGDTLTIKKAELS